MTDPLAELTEVFTRELEEGHAPSVEEYALRHPELADRIRELFPALLVLGRAGDRYAEVDGKGPQLDPNETLDDVPVSDGDFVTGVLGRLSERDGAFARYDLRGEVGRGGQGVVLAVWDGDLRRNLAMKRVLSEESASKDSSRNGTRSLGRFLEEAQITAQLDHPGIVPVHELGRDTKGDVYFTMKLVKGRDLRTVFELLREKEENWTQARVLSVLLRVCEAMAYAHAKGVIHRDLKPGNVMVGKFGEVYVMDWGLARSLDREDPTDIRVRPDATVEIRSQRHQPVVERGAPLVTMDGDVVGTPAYMSPEQALGDLEAMGPHSDVYAVGAMLYQLLTGEMPYVSRGESPSNRMVWDLVQKGPPQPVHELADDAPAELVAICERAMSRECSQRYPDMAAMADDLRAYLEGRVVSAYEAGSWAELRKWIARNRSLSGAVAAAFLAVVVGSLVAWMLKTQSDQNAALAATERDNVLSLSELQKLKGLVQEADQLWPPWPDKLLAYDSWLSRARDMTSRLDPDFRDEDPGHRARLAHVESRAMARTEALRERDRAAHPQFADLTRAHAELAALERSDSIRRGEARAEELEVDAGGLPEDSWVLMRRAWRLVAPDRRVFGREAEGLGLAILALDYVEDDEAASHAGEVLAWAYFANGRDQEALAEVSAAISIQHQSSLDVLEASLRDLRKAIDVAGEGSRFVEVEKRIADLERSVGADRMHFTRVEDEWWYEQLKDLIARLEALADPMIGLIEGTSSEHGWGIERRRAWAEEVEELTVGGDVAKASWQEALESIGDVSECPAYRGLELEPQLGLVPIGQDPDTGLWEFGHPLTGALPVRDGDGRLVITEATGLVLVLLPGGRFFMGSQKMDRNQPNYDPEALNDAPVQRRRVGPFFLSKFEMTQGQWERFTGSNPSSYGPGRRLEITDFMSAGIADGEGYSPLLHPVESVSWLASKEVCRRMGLCLPTDTQWEYAARGGTSTPFWTGEVRDTLIGRANLADRSAARQGFTWHELRNWPEFDDEFAVHAPVDYFAPNPFGLHSVPGNVSEWCSNDYASIVEEVYSVSEDSPPESEPTEPTIRGGNYQTTSVSARSAARFYGSPDLALHTHGLRPARAITGEISQVGEGRKD